MQCHEFADVRLASFRQISCPAGDLAGCGVRLEARRAGHSMRGEHAESARVRG